MPQHNDELQQSVLMALRARQDKPTFCVVGAGHGGLAMAGHLGIMGFPVRIYNRTDENLHAVRWHGGIKVTGEVEGFGPIQVATSTMSEAIAGADVIMVVLPATAHRFVAEDFSPGSVPTEHRPRWARVGGRLRRRLRWTNSECPSLSVVVHWVQPSRGVS